MNLTTENRYLDYFPSSSSIAGKADKTKAVALRIASVSAKVQQFLFRHIESTERTEVFTPDSGAGTKSIRLKGYPVSEIDTLTVYGDVILENDGDFSLDAETGLITFPTRILRESESYANAISVKYTGGMASDTADFAEKYPDIESLVCDQVYFELTRVQNIANKSIAGAASSSQLNEYGLLPALTDALEPYVMHRAI